MTVKVPHEVSLKLLLGGSGTSNKTASTKGTVETDLNILLEHESMTILI